MMAIARIDLPFPPSVHGLFRGGRWKGDLSPQYKAWRDEAGYRLNLQRVPAFDGQVRILIRLVAPDNRVRDSDNYLKGVLDLLVSHGVIASDARSTVLAHIVEWADDGSPCTVIVQSADADTWEQVGTAINRVFASLPVPRRGAA